MIPNSLVVTVMAVGTVPRARAALGPHNKGSPENCWNPAVETRLGL